MVQFPDITVSLEWAKALKKAGWPQEDALHVWNESGDFGRPSMHIDANGDELFAAPTAEEILRRLPRELWWEDNANDYHGELSMFKLHRMSGIDFYGVGYHGETRGFNKHEDSLANACAAMWCHLAENGLLKLDGVVDSADAL